MTYELVVIPDAGKFHWHAALQQITWTPKGHRRATRQWNLAAPQNTPKAAYAAIGRIMYDVEKNLGLEFL